MQTALNKKQNGNGGRFVSFCRDGLHAHVWTAAGNNLDDVPFLRFSSMLQQLGLQNGTYDKERNRRDRSIEEGEAAIVVFSFSR